VAVAHSDRVVTGVVGRASLPARVRSGSAALELAEHDEANDDGEADDRADDVEQVEAVTTTTGPRAS
jgi:hypothetical protein